MDVMVGLGLMVGLIAYFWKHDPTSLGFNGVELPGYKRHAQYEDKQ